MTFDHSESTVPASPLLMANYIGTSGTRTSTARWQEAVQALLIIQFGLARPPSDRDVMELARTDQPGDQRRVKQLLQPLNRASRGAGRSRVSYFSARLRFSEETCAPRRVVKRGATWPPTRIEGAAALRSAVDIRTLGASGGETKSGLPGAEMKDR